MSEDIDAPSETDPSRAVMERREEIARRLRELMDFLNGTGSLDGLWFGDKRPVTKSGRLGAFWWRERMRQDLNDAILALPEPPPSRGGGWRPGPFAEVHELKTWPEFYEAVEDERKPWELREFDRPYKVGDILHLREWRPHTERYSGRECWRGVTYLFVGDGGWLPKGKCIMGLARYQPSPAPLAPDGASELAEALSALRPFALLGELIEGETTGFCDADEFDLYVEEHLFARLKVGDFRRVAQAASRLRSQGSE